MKKPKLGSGKRFKKLKKKLSKQPGVYSPGGLTADIGRQTHGKKKMTELAQAGKRRKHVTKKGKK